MPQQHANRYIPSIDGLRALAVMAVLFFHVDFEWASGGFIGVDVFFVISGFLITRNIMHERDAGSWSLSNFYLRRVARLFPALFATIVCTLLAAWWVLSPSDLARLGQSSMMAVLSVGNIFFWLESGYFDANSATKPLLHTWSLAVEEQFYLVWPTMLILMLRLPWRLMIAALLILATVSLASAYLFLRIDPTAVFFLAPFRIHQFAVGALIAMVGWMPRKWLSSLISIISVLGIAAVCVWATASSPYLYSAVMPALLAGGMILTSRSLFAERVLATPAAVWLGRRSYSIYLAHWPIIVLWKMNTDLAFSMSEKILAVIISIIAGVLLFELIEDRFRFRATHSPSRRGRALFASIMLGLVAMTTGSHFWGNQGYPLRLSEEVLAATQGFDGKWEERQRAVREGICSHTTTSADASSYVQAVCSSPPRNGRSYLVVGDSFANDSLLVLKQAYPDIYFGQVTVPGCLLRLPKQFDPGVQVDCRKLYESAFSSLIDDPNYNGIILSSNWQDGHYYRINDILNYLSDKDLDIVVIGQRVRFRDRIPAIVSSSDDLAAAREKANALVKPEELRVNRVIIERFSERVKVLDFVELSCPDSCDIVDENGQLIYMDDSHFSLAGVRVIAERLRERRPTL